MKFPYGISHFESIAAEGYFYLDRTDRIPLIENAGKALLFIRPRRFGKSLWLSTLRHYYDIAMTGRFEELFGDLAIGQAPTPSRNQFYVLRLDFSCVDPTGSPADIQHSLHSHLNIRVRSFASYYREFPLREILIDPSDGMVSLHALMDAVRETGHPFYLLIDEYDNFANEIMSGIRDSRDEYKAVVHEKGPLKTFFKSIKAAMGDGLIERLFITGVSPVVMTDITSGFNIAQDIFLRPDLNDLCGFSEVEVQEAFQKLATEWGPDEIASGMAMMRTYYDGYTFSPETRERVYNPTLVLYFFEHFQRTGEYPREMLDANLATDEAKLEFAAALPQGRQLLLDIGREEEPVTVTRISNRFGVSEMLNDVGKTQDFVLSFLYYFGVLSIGGVTGEGRLSLRAPNLVTRGLYVNGIARFLMPDPAARDKGREAAEQVFTRGDIEPLREFVETRYFPVFRNRDYRWANELTVKTAFLTLLYDDIRFIMDSEREIGRGYADLTMIIRPDMRKYALLDVLIEFKYVSLAEAGLTGEEFRNLTPKELRNLPAMASRMAEAQNQVRRYAADLEMKYRDLRLNTFAVVSLGFERLWAEAAQASEAKE